ncbi:Trm112 family protein [bacterium]|nr:Trm112 family protein [candidate division CSSED10-310 bacterium]
MAVDKELLDILVCPKCKGSLELTETKDGLTCHSCRLLYRIIDDIPVMLIDEALPLDQRDEVKSNE